VLISITQKIIQQVRWEILLGTSISYGAFLGAKYQADISNAFSNKIVVLHHGSS